MMNIIIIEDEEYTSEDLKKNILKYTPEATIVASLKSIKQAVTYLKSNSQPDLFFSDIQLGDGLSFEIFKTIKPTAPVIFITAFDEYALEAFKANGIEYILKPFNYNIISAALEKFQSLRNKNIGTENNHTEKLLKWMELNSFKNKDSMLSFIGAKKNMYEKNIAPGKRSIIVYQKDKIIPLKLNEVALFHIENEIVKAYCFSHSSYTVNFTMDEMESQTGKEFFRANRQFLINRTAVLDVSQYFSRKLLINLSFSFKEKIIISKEKSVSFLEWLSLH